MFSHLKPCWKCTVEGPFSWLIFTHLAPLMKQINRLRSHLLSYVDLLTFKRSRIFGLSSMICRAAWHLGKICPLIYGCYENSDLENTDLRPPKNSDPWVSRKFRPPEKLRPLGVSKTQTLRKTQTPGCLEKSLGRPPRNTQTPGCLENSDPPKNLNPPKNSDPWVSRKLRPSEKFRPLGVSKNLSADPPKHSDPWVSRKLRPSIFFKYYN